MPRNTRPITIAVAAVVFVVSLPDVVKLLLGRLPEICELSICPWNGMRSLLWLPATSKEIQLAKNNNAPARRIALPFVQLIRYRTR